MAEGELIASVVIPAYNAASTLNACLGALADQSLPREKYEILVVDDGSRDATQQTVASFGARLLTQPHKGPAAARNLGVRESQGDIVLFTDADCEPSPHWIEALVRAFKDPEVAGAKGIYATRQKTLIARFVQLEYEDKYDKMKREHYIDFVDTYSAAYRKEVLLREEGFDPAFPRASGEDVDLSYRLSRRGHKLVFTPEAVVYHRHVDTLGGYFRRKFYVGFWRVLMYRKSPEKMIADSHTPQSLKLQCMLATVAMALLLGLPFSPRLAISGLSASLALFFLSSLPFSARCFKKDPRVGLVALPLLLVRAFALSAGFLAGIRGQLSAILGGPLTRWKPGVGVAGQSREETGFGDPWSGKG